MAMPDGRGRDIAPSRDLSPADREEDGARPRRLVDALASQNFLFTGAQKGRAFRRIWPLLSIVLPTVLAAVYFLLIAAGLSIETIFMVLAGLALFGGLLTLLVPAARTVMAPRLATANP